MASAEEPDVGRWAAIARKEATVKVDVPLLKSTEGLKTVVVDANALIGGGVKLPGIADQFITIRDVLEEVRDPASRFHLATLPVTIRCLEPSSEALAAVIKFSRATGDFHSLSTVDLKLVALAYTLEAELHGTTHIRSQPPPLKVTQASTREKDPPGWGSVENSEEWDDAEENDSACAGATESRILGSKFLNLQLSESDVAVGDVSRVDASEGEVESDVVVGDVSRVDALEGELKSDAAVGEVSRVDASEGAVDEDGFSDWQRASSRSTRRNYLKREAKRAARRQAAEITSAEGPYRVGDENLANSASEANACDRLNDDTPLTNLSSMMAPSWTSSIACMTADFAMQNVILQIGLRLLSTNGMHIRELNKWVLKCQGCNRIVLDVGRMFCPKCGNAGTLFKVSVTVGPNGTVYAERRSRRINLRGTRYSLPMPKGGREGAVQNPILREDQLPKPKKSLMGLDRLVLTDVNFTTARGQKTQNHAGVKTAAAVFGGRRNPNERRGPRKG